MCNGENSALRGFGSQVWHSIIGQVALRENGTDVSGASQFLNPPQQTFCANPLGKHAFGIC